MFTLRASRCPACAGVGRVKASFEDSGGVQVYYTDCPICGGAGVVPRPADADGTTDAGRHSAGRAVSHLLRHRATGAERETVSPGPNR